MRGIVWGYNYDRAVKQLEIIERSYEALGYPINYKKKHRLLFEIEFTNGDFWRILPYNDNARGYRTNVAYIDHLIDKEFIDKVITPTLSFPPFQAVNYF